jgi:nucleoside-diphosphate-sugar epimerase
MNVLITGATGFIGQHLLDELAGDDLQITVVSRQENPKFWCANKNFRIVRADISDKQALKETFTNIDVVVNLAAELKKTKDFEVTNIQGTRTLAELALENHLKKIVHLSSVGVVGMQYSLTPVMVDEDTACNPQNEYERTKLEAEKIIINSKVPFVILRPTNVFGDHHPKQALLGFLQRIKASNTFPMSKEAIVNYVYSKDVAHAIRFALQNNISNRVINVGESMFLKNFIELAAKELSVGCKMQNIPLSLLSAFNAFGYFEIGKVKERLRGVSNSVTYKDEFMKADIGYKYGLEIGIKNTIEFYKKNKAL